MTIYFLKMKTIVDNLTSVGNLVADDDFVLYLLGGLGSYYNLVAVRIGRGESVNIHKVYSILLTHECQLE